MESTKKILRNKTGVVEIDLFGGAITGFQVHNGNINPLTFKFSKEKMPANNQAGAAYQGHFLCLGRWGEPSPGEITAGMPDHGQIANILWEANEGNDEKLKMQATSPLEGLRIERTIQLDNHLPVFLVTEKITNINPLGRLYNMVQHPTLAAPFLDNNTIVNCNAASGFHYKFFNDPEAHSTQWPYGTADDKTFHDLSSSTGENHGVFSFIVNNKDELGWITAYAPGHGLLLGYAWKRSDYPWINLWQDWSGGQIRFRGLEFGTTGIHRPFKEILENGNNKVFGEKTVDYIDAGGIVTRSYISFLYKTETGFTGVDSIRMSGRSIIINTFGNDGLVLNTIFNDLK